MDDYKDRGLEIIHVVRNDGDGDGDRDADDAALWHHGWDHDKDGTIDVLNITVVIDMDDGLFDRYTQDCSEHGAACDVLCKVTPQDQIIDRGQVTVVDTCSVPPGGSYCTGCGYDDKTVREELDALLPPAWCGEAQP